MSQPILTTGHGAPIDDNQNSLTAGERGPVLLQDVAFIDKIAHFDRERIPERVVHAKGSGFHGYFEVTNNVTQWTKAKMFNAIGKRTPVFARFSTVGGESGSSDAARDPRGFALKHYTEEGNYDMVGNNTPIFFIRDPIKFPDFIHVNKRNPRTHLKDADMLWDFASLVPESIHQFMFLFSDRGIPASYRYMHGFSSHTYKWVNEAGNAFWVKYHYKSDQGIKNLSTSEAAKIESEDLDHAQRDMFEHIKNGGQASWTMYVQVIPVGEEVNYKWNIFDVTKVVPHTDYPLQKVGKLVMNKNVENYFAEVEQAAFAPANLVPGIEPSPDRMLLGRIFSYSDTQRYRLGPNHLQIPINCPYATKVANHQRDGPMCVNGNQGSAPNYEPNSHGPNGVSDLKQCPRGKTAPFEVSGLVGRYQQNHPNSDFEQPRNFWMNVLKDDERERLVQNIAGSLCHARAQVQARQVDVCTKVHPDFGMRLSEALKRHSKM